MKRAWLINAFIGGKEKGKLFCEGGEDERELQNFIYRDGFLLFLAPKKKRRSNILGDSFCLNSTVEWKDHTLCKEIYIRL